MLKSIKVGGEDFSVSFTSGLADCGVTDTIKQTILINSDLTEDNTYSTILHEIIECVNSQYDLNLSHQTISTLETALYSIWKDNKESLKNLL